MRIIAGKFKSRLIDMPKSSTRPTQDKVRESIFNIISGYPPGATVLELFAGSGSFGIEAISRGAKLAVFIDNNVNAVKTIKSNLVKLGIENDGVIVKGDVLKLIPKLYSNKDRFDIIFLDPPYLKGNAVFYDRRRVPAGPPEAGLAKKTLIKLDEYDILMPHGLIVVEHYFKDDLGTFKNLAIERTVIYGNTKVSFVKRKPEGK